MTPGEFLCTLDPMDSNYLCPNCGTPFSKEDERSLIWNKIFWLTCSWCLTSGLRAKDMVIEVSEACGKFSTDAGVVSSNWFHYTTERDWLETVRAADVWVHVGTRASAEALREQREDGGKPAYSFMYTLVLETPQIAAQTATDWNRWPTYTTENRVNGGALQPGTDVVRYVNRWEEPGEISLLVKPEVLQVVDTVLIRR